MHRRLGYGWVTLCAYLDPDSRTVDVGVALCSPLDRFSKKIGRAIASGRRKKRPTFGLELVEGVPPIRQIEATFRAWLWAEFGDERGHIAGGDGWIVLALSEIRREAMKAAT
jgi:hypothetical protein